MLTDREIQFLRRIHEAPNPRKLKALTSFVRELGLECESLESRFEIQTRSGGRPGTSRRTCRQFRRAAFHAKGHLQPASRGGITPCTATTTRISLRPIRRYPDLTVHRILDVLDEGKHPGTHFGQLLTLADHCSDREQRAEKVERELVRVKLLNYLSKRIGTRMEAVVTGVEDYGLFAQGVKLPAEGFIHVNSLQDDYYRFDPTTHSLEGRRAGNRFRLGDVIHVEIAHVDVDRRELDFRLLARNKKKPAASKKRPTKSRKGAKGQGTKKRAAGRKKKSGRRTGRNKKRR